MLYLTYGEMRAYYYVCASHSKYMIIYFYYRGQPKAGTGHKMRSVPFVFSTSRFQGPAFGCDKIVVIVTLLEAIKVIFQTKIITFWGTTSSPIFTRDYFMSENLRVDI